MPTKTWPPFEFESGEFDYFDYYGDTREQLSARGEAQRRPRREWAPKITDDWPEAVPVFVEELELYELYFADELDRILGIRE